MCVMNTVETNKYITNYSSENGLQELEQLTRVLLIEHRKDELKTLTDLL